MKVTGVRADVPLILEKGKRGGKSAKNLQYSPGTATMQTNAYPGKCLREEGQKKRSYEGGLRVVGEDARKIKVNRGVKPENSVMLKRGYSYGPWRGSYYPTRRQPGGKVEKKSMAGSPTIRGNSR